jgi:hypothetical protein
LSVDAATAKALRAKNMPWLCALCGLDLLFFLGVFLPQFFYASLGVSCFIPVVVLLITLVLPQSLKAAVVFWRIKNGLPGHRAFTKYALSDNRIDMAALQGNVGRLLPTNPQQQYEVWDRMFRRVRKEAAAAEPNRLYLLYRDMATISILMASAGLLFAQRIGVGRKSLAVMGVFFLVQYAATAVLARNAAVRCVKNVLAIHSSRKVEPPKPRDQYTAKTSAFGLSK